MEQRYYIFRTHVNLKRFYRYCLLRQYLLSLSEAGVYSYSIDSLKELCYSTGLNYNTLIRSHLPFYEKAGLLSRSGPYIILKRLPAKTKTLYTTFIRFETEIRNSKKPEIYFADIFKKKQLWKGLMTQANNVARKTLDKDTGKKYLQTVKRNNARFGVSGNGSMYTSQQNDVPVTTTGDHYGLYLSLRLSGKILGRSKTTAYKYINRLGDSDLLKVYKDKKPVITVTKDGSLSHRRKQNSYVFNW